MTRVPSYAALQNSTGESFGTKRALSSLERERVADLGAQTDLLSDELTEATRRFDLINPTVSRCESWLREQGPSRGGDYPAPTPAKDTAKTSAKLDKLRTQIEALIDERATVEEAPLPKAEALRRIDEWVALQAGHFHANGFAAGFSTPGRLPSHDPFVREVAVSPVDTAPIVHTGGSKLPWDIDRAAAQLAHDAFGIAGIDHTPAPAPPARAASSGPALYSGRVSFGPMLAWLLPEQLRSRLAAELVIDDEQAISAADRKSRLASVTERLHAFEVDEELLVCELEAAGEQCHRRSGFDPAIVLGARRVDVPAAPSVFAGELVEISETGRVTRTPADRRAQSSIVSRDRQAERDAGV